MTSRPIPGFPAYRLVRTAEGWRVQHAYSAKFLAGSARPGRQLRFHLRNGSSGGLNLSLEGWLRRAGVHAGGRPGGLPVPDAPGFFVERRPDGAWGVRDFRDKARVVRCHGAWLEPNHQRDGHPVYALVVWAGGHRRVLYRSLPRLLLEAYGEPGPGDGRTHAVAVDPAVPPDRWPQGLAWRPVNQRARARTRLTPERAREIYKAWPGRSQRDLAAEHGVTQSTVSAIVRGLIWSHATGARNPKAPLAGATVAR